MLVRERKCADIFRDLIAVEIKWAEITFFLDGIILVGNCIGVSIYRTYKSKVHKESVYVLYYCTTVVVQGTPHIPTGFCRRFTAFICMIQKIVINIFLRLISNLSAQEKSTSYDENCSNAITECNTGQISRARQTPIKHILLKKTLTDLIIYLQTTLARSGAQIRWNLALNTNTRYYSICWIK